MTLIDQVNALVSHTSTIEELRKWRDELRAPFNVKINALEKADREAKRAVREETAEKLCRALKADEKVIMQEHGYLNLFNPGKGDRFFDANATVYVYQTRKRVLWLNVTGTKDGKKFKEVRAFRLHEVASYNVRRAVE